MQSDCLWAARHTKAMRFKLWVLWCCCLTLDGRENLQHDFVLSDEMWKGSQNQQQLPTTSHISLLITFRFLAQHKSQSFFFFKLSFLLSFKPQKYHLKLVNVMHHVCTVGGVGTLFFRQSNFTNRRRLFWEALKSWAVSLFNNKSARSVQKKLWI